ncbi:MAG: transglycosylase SLT domain-containing protein [Polymorphobacter sp.]
MANTAIGTVIGAAGNAVEAAVRRASTRTGVDFAYLIAQARIESGLDPHARSRSSSATGLYQFTSATWLETVRKHGAAHGLEWAANALKDGVAAVRQDTRTAILALRNDAQASAMMAAEFAADNRDALESRLGRAVGTTELYLAHFLGSTGATRFLKANDTDTATSAAAVAPSAARANRSVFFAANGRARSVGEVLQRFAEKLGASGQPVSVAGQPVPVTGTALPVAAAAAPLTTRDLNQRQLAAMPARPQTQLV